MGSAIVRALKETGAEEVVEVTRESYEQTRANGKYDIVVNSAMPAKRYWARLNPRDDFVETVDKTSRLVHEWGWDHFVQISTVSARCQLDTVYGRNKAAAEALCMGGDALIVRLGAMYGEALNCGVLIDMVENGRVFVDGDSRYCFAPVEWVGKWIARHLTDKGVVELGGRNAIALKDVAAAIGSASVFEGALDHQKIAEPVDEAPEAGDVIAWVQALKERRAG